jgi:hypothetical protein
MAECPCKLTAEFMMRNGAVTAASMHVGADGDWRTHIAEEDKFFRPFIVEHFPLLTLVYDEDHRVFLFELDKFGKIVSQDRLKRHAAMEDWCAARLVEMGY